MNHSHRYFKRVVAQARAQEQEVDKLRKDFILAHVPRLHRLLMEKFPFLRDKFKYSIASNEDDPRRLTLLRGRKVIARNFEFE